MNFETKIPKSFSSGISKSKFKIDKLSLKIDNIKNDKNKIEKDLYNYEFEPSLDNSILTNAKIQSKIEYENKFENNKYIDKNDDNLINKLIKLKKEKHIFKKDSKESNNYNLKEGNQYDLNLLENFMLKNENELIEKYNNILCENKRIKKSMIIQQILVNEMKKDLENIKLEKSKYNEKDLIKEENDINKNNNYKIIIQQKNSIINELQNENMKLLNENLLLKEKLNEGQSQNHIETKIQNYFSSGIRKSKFKIEKISHKIDNIKNEKNKIENELYNYEEEPNLENINLTNNKVQPKIESENICDNNNYIDNNDDNLISKLIKLKKEKNIIKNDLKENNYYLKGNKNKLNNLENNMIKNKNELIEEYNNILCENKRIKKSMIIQQILVNEMKKDLENLKLEKSKYSEKELINDENDSNKNNNYKNLLQQKNNLINELQNENMKLLNENLLLKENLTENKNLKENKILDELFESIKQTAINLQNFNRINKIDINNDENNFLKNILEPINGKKENPLIEDKLSAINKFNEFLKIENKILINHSKKEKNDEMKINEYTNIDKEFNGLFKSENKFNYYNDKINKTTTALENRRTEKINNKFNLSNFKYNDRLEKSLLTKYNNNNRYIVSNTDLDLKENSYNKMKSLLHKNKINLKKKLLEKEGAAFKNSYISNNKNILNDSKESIDNKVREISDLINNKKNIVITEPIFFKKQKKIKIPVPKLQINKTSSYISSEKLNEKSFKYFENIPLKLKLNLNKINKEKKQKKMSYSNYDTSNNDDNDNERNKKSQLEHIKTDININSHHKNKLDFEYIKLNLIFKNMNNSNILSAEIKNTENSSKKYLERQKNNNLFNKYMNSAPKFLKIKDIKKANGLANEVMKPSFLKTNISLTLNNEEKENDKYIFKDIKRYEIIKKPKN